MLFVKAEKAEFHASEVTFVGFTIRPGQILIDPTKVKAVADWPIPITRKKLQQFLGFANFYRRFIRNYSYVAAPLTALTSPRLTFQWSSADDKAFNDLKTRFSSAPILVHPDPSASVYGGSGRIGLRGGSCPLSEVGGGSEDAPMCL